MRNTLEAALNLKHAPVGIWFTNEKPVDAIEMNPAGRPCVVTMLLAAAKGKSVVVSDETCPCPGGSVGLGFGDAFERRHASTPFLLSHGEDSPGYSPDVKLAPQHRKGERFFDCPATVQAWKESLRLSEAWYRYVVFRPVEARGECGDPDLVFLLANPDQLSALVIMTGYRNGRCANVVAPFCAGCQSIALALQQLGSEEPVAIMGMFDISQRNRISKELLSLTMPYDMFAQIEEDCQAGCLTTPAWEKIRNRYQAE